MENKQEVTGICVGCKHLHYYTLSSDEVGAGHGDVRCLKDHWTGLGNPIDPPLDFDPYEDCADFATAAPQPLPLSDGLGHGGQETRISQILKLSEWLNRELVWQDLHVRTTKKEFHKGALMAYGSVAAEILRLTAPQSTPSPQTAEGERNVNRASAILRKHLKKLYDGFNITMLGEHEHRLRLFILGVQGDLLDLDEGSAEGEIPEEIRKWIGDEVERRSFRVPYDGSNKFYDEVIARECTEIATAMWRKMKKETDRQISLKNSCLATMEDMRKNLYERNGFKAEGESLLPEGIDEADYYSVRKLADWYHKQLHECQEKLRQANDRIKELQEWHDSHV